MQCTASSSKKKGCGAEFIAMRECNRVLGPQLVKEADGYAIAKGKAGIFEDGATSLVASAPARCASEPGCNAYGDLNGPRKS